jgi:hypothetical protein
MSTKNPMNDDEFQAMLDSLAVNAARHATRVTFSQQAGISPNRLETMMRNFEPPRPDSGLTLRLSKLILATVTQELAELQAFKNSTEGK